MMRSTFVAALLSLLLCVAPAEAQQPAAAAADQSFLQTPSIPFGSRIQRTMHLLASSTPEHKHRVRILFYGQSITNGWTDMVRKDLRTRFPNADIVCENRAIGGFTAAWLSETAEADLYPFYPDLLFLQDYDALNPAMERMYAAVHDRTTAEVLAFTHHIDYCGDRVSYKDLDAESARIRELSEKYGFETVDVRTSWRKVPAGEEPRPPPTSRRRRRPFEPGGQGPDGEIALPHLHTFPIGRPAPLACAITALPAPGGKAQWMMPRGRCSNSRSASNSRATAWTWRPCPAAANLARPKSSSTAKAPPRGGRVCRDPQQLVSRQLVPGPPPRRVGQKRRGGKMGPGHYQSHDKGTEFEYEVSGIDHGGGWPRQQQAKVRLPFRPPGHRARVVFTRNVLPLREDDSRRVPRHLAQQLASAHCLLDNEATCISQKFCE